MLISWSLCRVPGKCMNGRALALSTTAAAAGFGGWPLVREAVQRLGEYTEYQSFQDSHFPGTSKGERRYARDGSPAPDIGEWIGLASLALTVATTAASGITAWCARRRSRRRGHDLVQLDVLAERTQHRGDAMLAATDWDVSVEQLEDWAHAWRAVASGPKSWGRNRTVRPNGRPESRRV